MVETDHDPPDQNWGHAGNDPLGVGIDRLRAGTDPLRVGIDLLGVVGTDPLHVGSGGRVVGSGDRPPVVEAFRFCGASSRRLRRSYGPDANLCKYKLKLI